MTSLNNRLDALVRTRVRGLSAFQVCGITGLLLAVAQSILLVIHQGLSLLVLSVLLSVAVPTFFGLAMATKIVTGKEQLIYYHQEIALMIAAGVTLWLLRQPVLPYLDVTILAIGTFLVCGRVGCLMVGCCHGRPCPLGVRYRDEHADAGFTRHYVGIRLFPIQIVESLWVLVVVAVGCAMVLRGNPPGAALAWYVVAYDIGRFGFELLRGDPARAYLRGFSEGQWTSVVLMALVTGAELAGWLPLEIWHVATTAGMVLAMPAIAFFRQEKRRLLQPRHVGEIAEILASLSAAGPVQIGSTSLGIRISTGVAGSTRHYALSSGRGVLREENARALAELIRQLKHPESPSKLVDRKGVFHLLVEAV